MGGSNFWPTSYSPRTKLLYIPAMTACEDVTNNKDLAAGQKASGWFVRSGGGYRAPERYESNLTVVDPFTGEVKKNVHLRYPNFSGTLATGGGLVFLALLDGTIAAYDDTTLEELWKINVARAFPRRRWRSKSTANNISRLLQGWAPAPRSSSTTRRRCVTSVMRPCSMFFRFEWGST